ncbi:MAG: methionyl-tRNA formyltransferase [Candidatus Omnitrophica bacterium]|nr:methionyl-tRNA formyltransferase [Candidatus Omnitrophota bacterium]
MRIVFFGSDDFAAVNLEHLLNSKQEIVAVVTSPDKPKGRGMKLSASPIKKLAETRSIPCLQPVSLKDEKVVKALQSYEADIFVVVAYGRLLTQEILNIPKMLCLNVHGSLLPKYRGAAPVNWAILNGEKETGVTIQKVALALDAGEIIVQEKMKIEDDEHADQLRARMADVGANLLVKVLDGHGDGIFPLKLQDESQVSWAPRLTKQMGRIDWTRKAQDIINQMRGLKPWPSAYTFYKGKMLKIMKAQISQEDMKTGHPGEIVRVSKEAFMIACADKGLWITHVQPEAGTAMAAAAFMSGHQVTLNFICE